MGVCGPSRSLTFGLAFMALVATALFVAAIATPNMITRKYEAGITDYDVKYGWWRGCVKQTSTFNGDSSESCKDYDADKCDLLPPNREQNDSNCDKFKTVKSFAIMACAFSGGSALFIFLLSFLSSCTTIPFILSFLCLNASVAFGVIASSIYINLAKPDVDDNGWVWGFSTALWLAAWCINALASLIALCTGAACGRSG